MLSLERQATTHGDLDWTKTLPLALYDYWIQHDSRLCSSRTAQGMATQPEGLPSNSRGLRSPAKRDDDTPGKRETISTRRGRRVAGSKLPCQNLHSCFSCFQSALDLTL